MPSFSVMRWVMHRHTDSAHITFYDFIYHVRSEQQFTVPRPCMEFPIPDKPSSWESIAQRLVDHPQDARRAEIEGMIRTGPKKDAEEADRLQSLPGSEQTQGIEEEPEAPSDPFEILTCSPSALLYTRCIMCLPTPEDKYMALSQMKDLGPHPDLPEWKERPDAAVMHHIVYFEDLQATGEEVTGYAVKYDFTTNELLIKRTQGIPPKTGGVTLDLWPPSSGGKNLNLFVGTPAKLTDHILSKQPIASDPGFDLVLKIIVAEWMCLVGKSLQQVASPNPPGETFTDNHLEQLLAWLVDEIPGKEGELRMALKGMPFPNQWSRANVDLKGLKVYNLWVADNVML